MLAEAASTGRPMTIFEPQRRNWPWAWTAYGRAAWPWRWLATVGIATPPRDMSRLQAAVRAAGGQHRDGLARDDLARTVARVKSLLQRPGLDYINRAVPDTMSEEAAE